MVRAGSTTYPLPAPSERPRSRRRTTAQGPHVFVGTQELTYPMAAEPRSLGRATMPTPTPWVTNAHAPPPREEPTLRGVVTVLGNLVGSRARVVANGVARDLTHSSRALTIEGLPDRQTTNLLRFWFVVAAGVVGFLLASTLANGVGMASSFASGTPSTASASRSPARHEMTGGTRVLIVTPLVMANARAAIAPEPVAPVVAAPVVAAPPPPAVRAVPVVAKAPPAKAPVVAVKAPAAPAPAAPPPNKSLLSDALK